MSPRLRAIAFFLAVFVSMALVYGRAVIQNDGITYYALTYSLIHDKNFDLTNESTLFRDLRTFQSPRTERIASQYSCGFAFLYSPILLLTGLIPSLNTLRPYAQNAAFPFGDGLGVFITSLLFGLSSIFFGFKMLRDYGEKVQLSLLISFAIFIGTPLIFYTFTTPSFVHVADTFLFSAIFYLTIRKDAIQSGNVCVRNVLVGSLLGLSVLLRNINFIFTIPIILGLLYFERQQGKKRALISIVEIIAGALPCALVQLSFNWTQYGSLAATGYKVPVTDEASDFSRMFLSLGRMWFHPSMGLFIWSPVTALALCGLIVGCVKRKPHSIMATICIASVVASLCFFRIMWPGASFGNRYFTQLYIFWVLGLYEICLMWRRPALIAGGVLVLWSFLLFNAYYINFASASSRKILSDFRNVSPIKVIHTTIERYRNDHSKPNPIVFWYRSLGSGPYPSLHFLIWHPDSRHRIKIKNTKAIPE